MNAESEHSCRRKTAVVDFRWHNAFHDLTVETRGYLMTDPVSGPYYRIARHEMGRAHKALCGAFDCKCGGIWRSTITGYRERHRWTDKPIIAVGKLDLWWVMDVDQNGHCSIRVTFAQEEKHDG